MIQSEDGAALIEKEDESDSSDPLPNPNQHQHPIPMLDCGGYNETVNVEVLLNCPHCHQTILYRTTTLQDSNSDSERNSATARVINFGFFGSANCFSGKTLKEIFTGVGETEKRHREVNRCFYIAVLIITLLIFTYLVRSIGKDGGKKTITSEANLFGEWDESKSDEHRDLKLRRLPQCIIIGARKCGTRALIDMLNLHPQVEKASVEVHFFDRDDNYGKGLEWYRNHMPETTQDQLSIEKSPSYFVTPEVPERVQGMNSSIKLILIVRDPVTRVISDYTQIYGSKSHNASRTPRLEQLVLHPDGSVNVHYKAIRTSLYSRYLQRWLDVFPPNQIQVIDGDALIRDPYSQLRQVERFLGLQPRLQRDNFYFNATKGFYCWRKLVKASEASNGTTTTTTTSLHCLNDSKGRPHPKVEPQIVSKLRRFYHPHNLRFYDMVDRDFGWPEK